MSEVKRYRKLIGEHPNSTWTELVRASDFDAIVSELAQQSAEIKRLQAKVSEYVRQFNDLSDFRQRTVEAYDRVIEQLNKELNK